MWGGAVGSHVAGQSAWLHFARKDYPGARRHLAISLPWANKIEPEHRRKEDEAQVLTVSAMVSTELCRFDEAGETLQAVLLRGQEMGKPRLQLGALDGLALAAAALGRWVELGQWGERMHVLGQSVGARSNVADAQRHLALAAASLDDPATAIRWYEQALVNDRSNGDRLNEAQSLLGLGVSQLERGDARAALAHHTQAQALYQTPDESLQECQAAAHVALCESRLGQFDAALSTVNRVLERLSGELAGRPAHETIELRWTCHQVLVALGDARAGPMLERLHADVQARATEVTAAADRERLIQAIPTFRAIVAAHGRRGESAASH